MDIFIEQLVEKADSKKDIALKILIGSAAVILAVGLFIVLMMFGLTPVGIVLAAGIFYGAYWLISEQEIEYEYILTNGDLDIDKIIAKKKRKRLLTIKVKSFDHFGKLSDAPEADDSVVTVLAASGYADEAYYADFNHDRHGKTRLIFSPNEHFREEMSSFIPSRAKK